MASAPETPARGAQLTSMIFRKALIFRDARRRVWIAERVNCRASFASWREALDWALAPSFY